MYKKNFNFYLTFLLFCLFILSEKINQESPDKITILTGSYENQRIDSEKINKTNPYKKTKLLEPVDYEIIDNEHLRKLNDNVSKIDDEIIRTTVASAINYFLELRERVSRTINAAYKLQKFDEFSLGELNKKLNELKELKLALKDHKEHIYELSEQITENSPILKLIMKEYNDSISRIVTKIKSFKNKLKNFLFNKHSTESEDIIQEKPNTVKETIK